MLKTNIVDPQTKKHLKVNGEGEITVAVHTHPPIEEERESLPFRQYFTDNGASDGSNDLRVDGSATNQDFYIKASDEYDVYVKTISVILADAGARLNLFGALAALTNGIEFLHLTTDRGETIIQEAIQTNLAFVRLGLGDPAVGDGTSAFRADLSGGGADSYLPVIDMSKTFGLPWGLRMRKNSKDKLIFRVKDDLSTGLDQFDIIGYGIKI
jgi:hypothetical protein